MAQPESRPCLFVDDSRAPFTPTLINFNLSGSLKHGALEEPFHGVALHTKLARVASQKSQEDGVSAPRGTTQSAHRAGSRAFQKISSPKTGFSAVRVTLHHQPCVLNMHAGDEKA